MCSFGGTIHFFLEAYKHGKTICALNEGSQLLTTLGFSTDKSVNSITKPTPGVILADTRKTLEGQVSASFQAEIAFHRHWNRINLDAVPA